VAHEVRFLRRREGRLEAIVHPVADGTTLLEAARAAGLPIARACSGMGLCARCGLQVIEGLASLSVESPAEQEAKRRNRIPDEWRFACQALVRGPLTATAAYW
jgi:ferredoxin